MNVAVLSDRFPQARGRLVLLGAFDPETGRRSTSIADPYGHSRDHVVGCYTRIRRCVRELARRILDDRDARTEF